MAQPLDFSPRQKISSVESDDEMEDFYQQIPRPRGALRRASTPWSSLSLSQRSSVSIDDVARAFPPVDVRALPTHGARAAILCGVADRDGEAYLILTRRALHLDRDPGLIAFPGGYIEEGEHPVDAAIREAQEEVGLHPSFVRVQCGLGTFERPNRGVPVVGYLGFVGQAYELDASVDEVHEIFELPVASLLVEGSGWQEEWGSGDQSRAVSFFTSRPLLGNNLVWGLTAAFLWHLLDKISVVLAIS
jgi:8-oxo-dGTP pyrophosphatase MutT (NUDIX family)